MTAYKLVTIQFKWWGLQVYMMVVMSVCNDHPTEGPGGKLHPLDREENLPQLPPPGVASWLSGLQCITIFQVFCWTDRWHGMTMEDIRALEEQTKKDLDEERAKVGNS